MPPFKIHPPGVKHQRVYSRAFKEMQYRRMNSPNWPPEGASPLHPIEPWGRQFFVFNAHKSRAASVQDAKDGHYQLHLNKRNGTPTETVLCITDFARRPMAYLSHADFEALGEIITKVKGYMEEFKAKLPRISLEDSEYKTQKLLSPERHYGMQRVTRGNHTSYGIKKGVKRERKI